MNILSWWQDSWFVCRFSLKCIWARKSSLFATAIFALCLLTLFPFALGTKMISRPDVSLGCYWAISEFVAAMIIGRIFFPEQEGRILDFLLIRNIPRSAIFFGKFLFTFFYLLLIQICVTLFWLILFNVSFLNSYFFLFLFTTLMIIFNIGSSALGVLVASLAARSTAKELLHAILFFPLQSALLLGVVSVALISLEPSPLAVFSLPSWWAILTAYPTIFLTFGLFFSDFLFLE